METAIAIGVLSLVGLIGAAIDSKDKTKAAARPQASTVCEQAVIMGQTVYRCQRTGVVEDTGVQVKQ